MGFLARIKGVFSRKKPKITLGLALGSGGAKGLAHIGMLKAFEENGIKFDIVTGTSIGSIVGALYCNGFSSSDMTGIIESLNRKEFAKNIKPFADMDFAEKYISEYLDCDIEELALPFAAWATDAETNEGVLLNKGNVARALTASAAIPPFFRAVEIGDKRLYDGAFTNAIPADVCRDMGASVVVACDLSAFTKPEEDKSKITRLVGSAINAFVPVRTKDDAKTRGYDAADVMLRPNLIDYKPTDVSRTAMDNMFEIGYEEAVSRIGEIKEAIERAQAVRG